MKELYGHKMINGKRRRLHIWAYLKAHPEIDDIPEGFVVHHLDWNRKNNHPANLVLLSISNHHALHASKRKDFHHSQETKEKMAKAHIGKKRSPETTMKIAQKNRLFNLFGCSTLHFLNSLGMSGDELAKITGTNRKTIYKAIRGYKN